MSASAPGLPSMSLTWGAETSRGRVRAGNEDSFLARAPMFFVADGMGGHEAGELASAAAVRTLSALTGSRAVEVDEVRSAMKQVGQRVRSLSGNFQRIPGTTVSGVAVVMENQDFYWLVANLGDSRTYRLAEDVLEQLSMDHSEVQELVEAGELAPEAVAHHPRRHVVTRAFGAGLAVDPDYLLVPLASNDRILVCSDGLTSELDDHTIAQVLIREKDPQAAAVTLVALAIRAGGHDNVTVIVVDAERGPVDPHGPVSTGEEDHESHTDDTLPRGVAMLGGER